MAFFQRRTAAAVSDEPPPPQPTSPQTTTDTPSRDSDSSFFSQRSRKQFGLFAAGAGFFLISRLITRRSLARRYAASRPAFYHPSNRPPPAPNGAMEAFEALNIATINVFSLGIMVGGGLLWALDISSLTEMRQRIRTRMGIEEGTTERDADEEMEEWLATVLARKEDKEHRRKKSKDRQQKDAEVD